MNRNQITTEMCGTPKSCPQIGSPVLTAREPGKSLSLGTSAVGEGVGVLWGGLAEQPAEGLGSVPVSALGIGHQMSFPPPREGARVETFGYFTLKWALENPGRGKGTQNLFRRRRPRACWAAWSSSQLRPLTLNHVTRSSWNWFSTQGRASEMPGQLPFTKQGVILPLQSRKSTQNIFSSTASCFKKSYTIKTCLCSIFCGLTWSKKFWVGKDYCSNPTRPPSLWLEGICPLLRHFQWQRAHSMEGSTSR